MANHAIKFYLIVKLFKNHEKQLRRGENAYSSGHVKSMSFDSKAKPAIIKGRVQASMKRVEYSVEVLFDVQEETLQTHCSCVRGQVLCHHIAAMLYFAHYNISATDIARTWGTIKKTKSCVDIKPIEELYHPTKEYSVVDEKLLNLNIEKFKQKLGSTNVVGFSWLLKKEAPKLIHSLVPSIEDILFSKDYLECRDKEIHMKQKCFLNKESILGIATSTVGQSTNDAWLVARKYRLTASKFGLVLKSCLKDKYPSSLFKNLLEGYDLSRVLAVQWGRNNEHSALKQFCEITSFNVSHTGLWLHECGFLGASPDGLINDDAVLEIKCPYKYRNCISLKDEMKEKTNFFYYDDGNVIVNTNHAYYHQVQGQLHLTGREKAYFMTWTPQDYEILVITKDLNWEKNLDILKVFYLEQFVPAILGTKI